jgi:hypothetical protein
LPGVIDLGRAEHDSLVVRYRHTNVALSGA